MATMTPEVRKPAEVLRQLATGASIEVTPDAVASVAAIGQVLGRGRSAYVPLLPRSDPAETVAACRRLIAEGLVPVPHLAARALPSRRHLDEWLARLAESGVERVLLVAGDSRKPVGPFRDTLAVLETGLLARHGFRRVGVAGHPEGHPRVGSDALWRALAQKAAYARETDTDMWLVSQFAFEAAPIATWLRALDEADVGLPVWIGVPGPAQLRTLLSFALRCGVRASTTVIRQRPSAAFKLAARWEPDALVAELARLLAADQAGPLAGIHLFAFGGVRHTAAWLDALRADPTGIVGAEPSPEHRAVAAS